MNKQRIDILRELCDDWKKGAIGDFSAMIFVDILVNPTTPSELDIEWAKEIVKLRKDEYDK